MTQKQSVEFLYTNKEVSSERKIMKIIPFTIASKRTKYLDINLTKDMKGLHADTIRH